jgi:prepilin-type N-terminal cleavage/methylation domain-containing protein
MMRDRPRHSASGFTLIELLVVMGILVLLAVLTGISVSQISREARLSSGVNQVISALGAARSYAIQNNVTVMLTFVVNVDRDNLGEGERVELVLAEASGEISTRYSGNQWYDERYVPVPGLPAVQLPRGIKVAGPLNTAYGEVDGSYGDGDTLWVSQPGGKWRISNEFVVSDEIGRQIGVIFGPDGTMVTRNVMGAGGSGAVVWPYLDADRSRVPELINEGLGIRGVLQYVAYDAVGDECDVHPIQWLGVYDDEALRRATGDSNWGGENGEEVRNSAITNWVDQFGVPVFFNRYTGVAETSSS